MIVKCSTVSEFSFLFFVRHLFPLSNSKLFHLPKTQFSYDNQNFKKLFLIWNESVHFQIVSETKIHHKRWQKYGKHEANVIIVPFENTIILWESIFCTISTRALFCVYVCVYVCARSKLMRKVVRNNVHLCFNHFHCFSSSFVFFILLFFSTEFISCIHIKGDYYSYYYYYIMYVCVRIMPKHFVIFILISVLFKSSIRYLCLFIQNIVCMNGNFPLFYY